MLFIFTKFQIIQLNEIFMQKSNKIRNCETQTMNNLYIKKLKTNTVTEK